MDRISVNKFEDSLQGHESQASFYIGVVCVFGARDDEDEGVRMACAPWLDGAPCGRSLKV